MNRRLFVPGALLWLAGLITCVVGMNIGSDTGKLVAVIGCVVFFIGLGIVGAAWLMMRKNEEEKKREE